MEACANCDRPIGKLETPYLWGDSVVCGPCSTILATHAAVPAQHATDIAPYQAPEAEIIDDVSDRSDFVDMGSNLAIQQSPGRIDNSYVSMTSSVSSTVVVNHYHAARSEGANPGVAAILSFLIPGLGQMYLGKVGEGVAWLVGTFVGYCFFIFPGVIVHIVCVISAATYQPPRRKRRY